MAEDNSNKGVFSDLYHDGKTIFFDKLTSPLISSFIISWLLTNYQAVLIIFSEAEIEYKLWLLSGYFHQPCFLFYKISVPNWLLFGLFIPLLASYLYIYQYPKIGNLFHLKAADNKHNLNLEQSQLEGKAPHTPEQVQAIHDLYQKRLKKLNSQVNELQKESEAYESVIEQLEKELTTKNSEEANESQEVKDNVTSQPKVSNPSEILTKDQIQIIKLLGKLKDTGTNAANESYISQLSQLTKSRIEYALKSLNDANYISYTVYGSPSGYYLSPKGLKAYISFSDKSE